MTIGASRSTATLPPPRPTRRPGRSGARGGVADRLEPAEREPNRLRADHDPRRRRPDGRCSRPRSVRRAAASTPERGPPLRGVHSAVELLEHRVLECPRGRTRERGIPRGAHRCARSSQATPRADAGLPRCHAPHFERPRGEPVEVRALSSMIARRRGAREGAGRPSARFAAVERVVHDHDVGTSARAPPARSAK